MTTGTSLLRFDGFEFIFVKKHEWCMIFNFCNNVLIWRPKKGFYRLTDLLEFELLMEIDITTDWMCNTSGGCGVFSSEHDKILYFVNMVDLNVIKTINNEQKNHEGYS